MRKYQSQMLLINNDVHIIGGIPANHSILKQNDTEPQKLYDFEVDLPNFEYHRSVYLPEQQKIYTFGGYNSKYFRNHSASFVHMILKQRIIK